MNFQPLASLELRVVDRVIEAIGKKTAFNIKYVQVPEGANKPLLEGPVRKVDVEPAPKPRNNKENTKIIKRKPKKKTGLWPRAC